MSITPWEKVGEPKTLAEGYGKSLVRQKYKDHRGEPQDFFFIEGGVWCVMLAMTKSNKLIMVRQFEQGAGATLEQIPGGGIKQGESAEDAARRELKEETGYVAGGVVSLGKFWLDPRSSHTYGNVFFAQNCMPVSQQHLDRTEQIEIFLVSPGEFVRRIFASRHEHRTEAIALMRAFPYFSFANQIRVIWAFIGTMMGGPDSLKRGNK
jgi:8-oxo-dGTP pyrophosphatase MutT (NUDIX family)